jgi:hypothetical protein
VLIDADVEPADAVTGAADVARAVTIFPLVATAETTVPVSSPVSAILRASAESTELSAGTGSAIAVAADVPAVAGAEPPTVKVVVAALAGVATSVPTVMAATIPRAIFLNEFIHFSFLL